MSAIIPCIFGTTRGFEIIELAPLPFKMKDLLVAITHGEVELALEDSCVKMLRIKAGSEVFTWIGLYRKAYEMGFSREGGYYGAGVWLSDTTVNARHVLDALEDLTQQIRRLAIEDRKFQRTLADIVQMLVPSQALSALLGSKAPYVKGGISTEAKNCAFISQPQAARDIVNWAQTDALAHNFQAIIVAPASAFPKAGASGNITQYVDIPSLERALERDYVARLAKLDSQVKEGQKRAQALEAEAAQRSAEIQTLKQKNSQLEMELFRSRTLVKAGGREVVPKDDPFRFEHIATAILASIAVVSIILTLGLGWFYLDAQDEIKRVGTQLADVRDKLANSDRIRGELKGRLAQVESDLALANERLRTQINTIGPSQNSPETGSDDGSNMKPIPRPEQAGGATVDRPGGITPPFSENVSNGEDSDYAAKKMSTLTEAASRNVEIAVLAQLASVTAATQVQLKENVKDMRLALKAEDEVPSIVRQLMKDGFIELRDGKYSITDKGKDHYRKLSE